MKNPPELNNKIRNWFAEHRAEAPFGAEGNLSVQEERIVERALRFRVSEKPTEWMEHSICEAADMLYLRHRIEQKQRIRENPGLSHAEIGELSRKSAHKLTDHFLSELDAACKELHIGTAESPSLAELFRDRNQNRDMSGPQH
jgi:hypothetical protein